MYTQYHSITINLHTKKSAQCTILVLEYKAKPRLVVIKPDHPLRVRLTSAAAMKTLIH